MKSKLLSIVLFVAVAACEGQKPFGTELLKLEKEIPMPSVKGRIDHMATNIEGTIVYVAALGNNTVEVIDLKNGTVIRSIRGVQEPQGVAYLPGQNEIAIASGRNGDCVFINASTFAKVATIHLPGDADNIRYDAAEKRMYVGYGSGGLAVIDPLSHKQVGNIMLPAHPESFQLDKKNNRIYVNLPDDQSIAVIDIKHFTVVATWKMNDYRANFPMALDTAANIVFVGFRRPAVLVGFDSNSGKEVSRNELVGDVDDIFYDADKREIIASGGDGFINVLSRQNGGLKMIADIPARNGARTSLLVPRLRLFLLAERAISGKPAAIAVYRIKD